MVTRAVLAAAVLLFAGATSALADVAGQIYEVDVSGTTSGDFTARVQFVGVPGAGNGIVGIDIENAGDATGLFTATELDPNGVVTTVAINGISSDDGYFTSFQFIAIDIKQVGGLVGFLLRKRPGVIPFGVGFSSAGDLFILSGEEAL